MHFVDDNTIPYTLKNLEDLKTILVENTNLVLTWFKNNCLMTNEEKYRIYKHGGIIRYLHAIKKKT